MDTIIRMRPSELTPDFLERLKNLFKNDNAIEITISPVPDFGLTLKESRAKYISRVNQAISNLENKKEVVTLSIDEFEALTNDLLKK